MKNYKGWDKFIKVSMLVMATVFFVIGLFGIADGIRSVIVGGYADNIVLGVIIAFGFPIPCLWLYIFVRQEEERK